MTPTDSGPVGECRICGDEVPASELKYNDGICDACDNEIAADSDQSWGAHEHG